MAKTVALAILLLLAAAAAQARLLDPPVAAAIADKLSWLNAWKPRRTQCDSNRFRKSLLVPIKEMPFVGLFAETHGNTRYEASGMTSAMGWLWVVFDNLHALGRVDEHFSFRDERNTLVGELGGESQFEGLTYVKSTGHFIAIEEEMVHEEHGRVPFTHEIKLTEDHKSYELVQRCRVHFEVKHENKGLEGLHYHEDEHGHKFLMGLCEGNFCEGGRRGDQPGNGRVVVAEFNDKTGDDCAWDVLKVVEVPSTAYFKDYSGMAFRGNRVAIISQENSALWLGTFDFEKLEFTSEGRVYHFPRDVHCDMIWCNVEGIEWIDDTRFAISSDKAKRVQPARCMQHDQRISIFALPASAVLPEPSAEDAEADVAAAAVAAA